MIWLGVHALFMAPLKCKHYATYEPSLERLPVLFSMT